MNIVFDYQIFTAQLYGGISRYYCALASRLSTAPGVSARIIAPLHQNGHLRELGDGVVSGRYLPRWPRSGGLVRLVDRALFPLVARAAAPDLVHETYYAERPTYRGPAARVVTVVDMIHERLPSSFGASDAVARAKAAAIRRADHVICISESTRRDLLSIHHLPDERVSVVHLGYDRLSPRALTAAALVGDAPYLLHVGARAGYKNFAGLLRAFAASRLLRTDFRLVCLGGGAVTEDESAALRALGLRDDAVRFVEGDDAVLAALYAGAAAFVYPSLYEGFGIPPLEAMALGCPVVCSDASSLPEVAGDAAEYFHAADPDDLLRAIERVVSSPGRRAELIALGYRRAGQFSWDRCARETAAVYADVLGRRR